MKVIFCYYNYDLVCYIQKSTSMITYQEYLKVYKIQIVCDLQLSEDNIYVKIKCD